MKNRPKKTVRYAVARIKDNYAQYLEYRDDQPMWQPDSISATMMEKGAAELTVENLASEGQKAYMVKISIHTDWTESGYHAAQIEDK